MRKLYLFIFLVLTVTAKAQNKTPELITGRPDQTESSIIVPHKSLQIETGFVLENDETDLVNQTAFTYNTTLLRYGLFENFELRLGLGYFIESYGLIPEDGKAEHLLDNGFTYLLLTNFQLDVSAGICIQNSIDNFISLGLTYRLPE